MGWIVTPLVLLSRKPYVIVVESAFWRLQPGVAVGWKRRLSASLHESLGRWVVRNADLAIFTQDEYRASMLGANVSRGHVIPASLKSGQYVWNRYARIHRSAVVQDPITHKSS
jgi:hypothetical protein